MRKTNIPFAIGAGVLVLGLLGIYARLGTVWTVLAGIAIGLGLMLLVAGIAVTLSRRKG